LAGIAGAALAAWWWRGRQAARRINTSSGHWGTGYADAPETTGLGGGPT
jgi:hypothetical protein